MSITNRRLPTVVLALAGCVAITATFALAQQPPATSPSPAGQPTPPATDASPPAPQPANPGSTTAAPASPPASAPAAGDRDADADPNAPPPKPAAAKGSPQRFEPTEKVRPDFDVAFPIDI